jgi:serine/threonine-protein kinase RsbW
VTERLEILQEARAENLRAFRDFVEEGCRRAGAQDLLCSDLKQAVDEACHNIIVHGYGEEGNGAIRVSFEHDAERMVVVITDRARPFSPEAVPQPDLTSDWRARRVGGLGWHLINRMVDEVAYEPGGASGNRLTLVKRLQPTKP